MKKMYLLIAIAAVVSVVFIACGTKSNSTKVDATELAQFEAWKADKVKSDAAELAQFEAWKVAKEKPVVQVVKKSAPKPVTYKSPVMTSESQNSAKVAKKGWSKAAKGAVIGAAGGAVIGAVINKRNRAAGAVIGGVIGGGGGYVLGRTMDKKDGRY